MSNAITLEAVGRRLYFSGNTYPVKGILRDGGAKWDAEREAWWLGSVRRELAEQLAVKANQELPAAEARANSVARWIPVPGGGFAMRIPGSVDVGATVTVAKRDGSTQEQVVRHVVERREEGGQTYTIALAPERKRASNYDPEMFRGYGQPRGGYRRACKTDGNCSSVGSGRSCGGYDCDGY